MQALIDICLSARFVGSRIIYTFAASFRFWDGEFTRFTYSKNYLL